MPLRGIPDSVNPELLFALAKMGHGDTIVVADANFPSDATAMHCVIKVPIRVHGLTSAILEDILKLLPLDQYVKHPVAVMDRVESDKERELHVPAYSEIARVSQIEESELEYVERFAFYELSKAAFAIVQTDDRYGVAIQIIYPRQN